MRFFPFKWRIPWIGIPYPSEQLYKNSLFWGTSFKKNMRYISTSTIFLPFFYWSMSLSPTRRRLSHNIFPRGTIWGNKSEGGGGFYFFPFLLLSIPVHISGAYDDWPVTSPRNGSVWKQKNIQAQQPFLSLINWNRGQEVFSPFLRRIFSSRVDWANGGKTKWVLLAQKEGKILVGWRAVKTGDTVSFRTILRRRGERMLRPLKKEKGGNIGAVWLVWNWATRKGKDGKRRSKCVSFFREILELILCKLLAERDTHCLSPLAN